MGSVGSNGSPRPRSAIRAVAARGAPVKERAIDTSHEVELVPAEEQKSSFAAPASLSPRCRVAAHRCSSRRRSSRARSPSLLAVSMKYFVSGVSVSSSMRDRDERQRRATRRRRIR